MAFFLIKYSAVGCEFAFSLGCTLQLSIVHQKLSTVFGSCRSIPKHLLSIGIRLNNIVQPSLLGNVRGHQSVSVLAGYLHWASRK